MKDYQKDQAEIFDISNIKLGKNEHIVPYIWGVKLATLVNEIQSIENSVFF